MATAGKKIPDNIRQEIATELREGIKPSELANKYKTTKQTVCNIAKENGIDLLHQATKKAVEVQKTYGKIERCKLIDKFFLKLNEQLDNEDNNSNDMRNLSIALGTIIDKRRLEDGEVTERKEVNDAREHLTSQLDQLAERRGKKAAS